MVQYVSRNHGWDFSEEQRFWLNFQLQFIKSHYGSERPMGLVLCYNLRNIWDWSHTLHYDISGTSQDFIFHFYLLSPIHGSERLMGLVPYLDLNPIAHMGIKKWHGIRFIYLIDYLCYCNEAFKYYISLFWNTHTLQVFICDFDLALKKRNCCPKSWQRQTVSGENIVPNML